VGVDDQDYLKLIAVVTEELRGVGLEDIADPKIYLEVDLERGDATLFPPHRRLISMLVAFNRAVKVRDRAMLDDALKRIGRNTMNEGPRDALYLTPTETGEGRPVSLSEAPYLGEVRARLENLIIQLGGADHLKLEDR
jgi:hypothetical protein